MKALTDVGVARILKRAAKRAGLDAERLWPHCLRAAFYNMLVGRVDDTLREFLFGHGIGVRVHYFAPQQIDKVREAYAGVDWDRTRLVKVENRKEVEELKAEIAAKDKRVVELTEKVEHLTDLTDRLWKMMTEIQQAKTTRKK